MEHGNRQTSLTDTNFLEWFDAETQHVVDTLNNFILSPESQSEDHLNELDRQLSHFARFLSDVAHPRAASMASGDPTHQFAKEVSTAQKRIVRYARSMIPPESDSIDDVSCEIASIIQNLQDISGLLCEKMNCHASAR